MLSESVQLLPCECSQVQEQSAVNGAVAVDPAKKPDGTPASDSQELLVTGIWIQNPSTSVTLYFGYNTARDLNSCFQIPPGGDKFFGIVNEAEKLVAIPKLRLRPFHWKLNAASATTAIVILFL